MRQGCLVLCTLLVSLLLPLTGQGKSFPSAPDATLAQQQQWGSFSRGYITDGCWHGPSATTSVSLPSCRAMALDTTDPETLKGFEELTPRTLTYSGGDGTYWLGGRWNPSQATPGWTCLAGTHYCWVKLDTQPLAVDGVLLLGKVTVTAGAVTAFTVMAPWRRTTPYAVPAGTTIVLGVCPEAGRWPIVDANGTTTGLLRFGPGACGHVYPEWWGADPTGLADSTAAWQHAMAAVSGLGTSPFGRIPIACEGTYKITGPLTVQPHLNIQGRFKTATTGTKEVACQFNYTGTGDLFVGPDIGQSYGDLDFRHLRIVDVASTGTKAFNLYEPSGMTMENIAVQGFHTPYYLNGQVIYSRLSMLQARLYRDRCLEVTRTANFASIEVICSASQPTTTYGVRVGLESGTFGTSTNLHLRALVEVAAGLPIQLARIRGINAELYVEQPGVCADYSGQGAIYLSRIDGGRIHLSTSGNCSGGPPGVARGLHIANDDPAPPEPPAVDNSNNLIITGWVNSNYTIPVDVDTGPGLWGINLTGLQFDPVTSLVGNFATGLQIGENYWTHGGAPLVDEGRGSTVSGTTWRVGDMIWTAGGANQSANMFWQVVVAGNPPQTARLMMETITPLTAAPTVAVPPLRVGNTFYNRLTVEGGATPITNLGDAVGGICVHLRATGTRTIDHTSPSLRLSAPYPMVAGNTLVLCADDHTGPWREYGRCATCVP